MSNQLNENKEFGLGDELDDILPEDIDALIQSTTKRRQLKIRLPIAILILLLVSAGSFWGGAAAKNAESGSSSFSLASLRSAFTGSSFSRSSFFGSSSIKASTPTASGEVVGVKGNTVFITTSSGVLLKILVDKNTVVTRNSNVKVSSLSIGDTVSIDGKKTAHNTVQAASIAATAQGMTTTTLSTGAFNSNNAG